MKARGGGRYSARKVGPGRKIKIKPERYSEEMKLKGGRKQEGKVSKL